MSAAADPWAGLFPAVVHYAITDPVGDAGLLPDLERRHASPMAPARAAEYAAGRTAARRALRALGTPAAAIDRRGDRSPVWPDGVTGSITHCEGFCGAAVARQRDLAALGVDAERPRVLEPEVLPLVTTAAERAWLATQPDAWRATGLMLLFSAKESAYKARYQLVPELVEFGDAEVRLEGAAAGRGMLALHWRASLAAALPALRWEGRWVAVGGILHTAVWTLPA